MSSTPARRTRTITCVGFDWRAEVSLKETLALLHGKTADGWQYSDELVADVVLYESSNALAQAMVRRSVADGAQRVFFPSASTDEGALTLRYPFGASRLIACLDHASQQLAGAPVTATAHSMASLCQRLDDALRSRGVTAVALRTPAGDGLLRPADQQLCWPRAMDLDETVALLSGDVAIQPLHADDPLEAVVLHQLARTARVAMPWEPLLWAIGITRSGSHLLHRIDALQPYRLRRWPDFGVIGHRASDLRFAALLVQRDLSPRGLAALAAIPLSVAGSFLNACALGGLLETATAEQGLAAPLPLAAAGRASAGHASAHPAPAARPAESGFGGMLRRIRHAFALDS